MCLLVTKAFSKISIIKLIPFRNQSSVESSLQLYLPLKQIGSSDTRNSSYFNWDNVEHYCLLLPVNNQADYKRKRVARFLAMLVARNVAL